MNKWIQIVQRFKRTNQKINTVNRIIVETQTKKRPFIVLLAFIPASCITTKHQSNKEKVFVAVTTTKIIIFLWVSTFVPLFDRVTKRIHWRCSPSFTDTKVKRLYEKNGGIGGLLKIGALVGEENEVREGEFASANLRDNDYLLTIQGKQGFSNSSNYCRIELNILKG